MSKAEAAQEASGSLTLTDNNNNEIHPPQEQFIAIDPNQQLKWFYITCFVIIAVTLLICITFWVIFKEHALILMLMLSVTASAVYYEVIFCAWRRWYLSYYLKHHGILSLAKVTASLPLQNGMRSVAVEFSLDSSNGTAVTPMLPGDGVGTRRFIMTPEAYNKAIQSQGGIPMLFEAFAKPPPLPDISEPFNNLPHHGIAIPVEGEFGDSFKILINMIVIFILIWLVFQEVPDASKEDGMEWLLPIFYLLLGIHFIILFWAFWTAVTGHAGLEYKYRKSMSDAEWKEWRENQWRKYAELRKWRNSTFAMDPV